MTDSPSEKSPVDKLLDLGVYAPLGLLLTRDRVIGDLAEAGRKQVAFSRSLGRAALKGLARSAAPSNRGWSQQGAEPSAAATSASVDGYDDMSARQVIARVATCTAAEAAWMRTRESAGKKRVTIMRALDSREGTSES